MAKNTLWDMADNYDWDVMDDNDDHVKHYKNIIKLWDGIKLHINNQHQTILTQQEEIAYLKNKINNVLGIISEVKKNCLRNIIGL